MFLKCHVIRFSNMARELLLLSSLVLVMKLGGGCCAGNIGYVVLDEADKMLSLGFKAQLDQIWEASRVLRTP